MKKNNDQNSFNFMEGFRQTVLQYKLLQIIYDTKEIKLSKEKLNKKQLKVFCYKLIANHDYGSKINQNYSEYRQILFFLKFQKCLNPFSF